jgi:hypothetical protein
MQPLCGVLSQALGQRLSALRHHLEYPDLHAHAERALGTLVEHEVCSCDADVFWRAFRPFREVERLSRAS